MRPLLPQDLDPEVRGSLEELFTELGQHRASAAPWSGLALDRQPREEGERPFGTIPGDGGHPVSRRSARAARTLPSRRSLEARLGCHRVEALGLALLAAARDAMARSQWSSQPRFSVRREPSDPRQVLQPQVARLARGERGSAAPEDPDSTEARALSLLGALVDLSDPMPSRIREALALADRLTPSTEGVWLLAGLDKWVSDHRWASGEGCLRSARGLEVTNRLEDTTGAGAAAGADRTAGAADRARTEGTGTATGIRTAGSRNSSASRPQERTGGCAARSDDPSDPATEPAPTAAKAQRLRARALASYERLAALPLPARQRAGALAAAADIRARHLGDSSLALARAAVELEPGWTYPHLVRLHCALCTSSRVDAEASLEGLQSSLGERSAPTGGELTDLLQHTRLGRELPPWAHELHPALTNSHDLLGGS